MANPWDNDPIVQPSGPRPLVRIPPKPPANYGAPGAPRIAPIPGGPDDPETIRRKAQLEADIRLRSGIAEAQAKAAIEAQQKAADEARKRQKTPDQLGAAQRDLLNVVDLARQARRMNSGWTTGFGSALSGIPASDARNMKSVLSTIGSNTAFDRLQKMRDESPTGGALGQVSNIELELLKNAVAALDQGQGGEQFDQMLRSVEDRYRDMYLRVGGDPSAFDESGEVMIEPYSGKRRDIPPPAIGAGGQGGGDPPGGGQQPPSGGAPPPGIIPGGQSGYSREPDPTRAGASARMNQLLQSGAPDDQIRQYAGQVLADPASVEAVLQYRRQNPNYRGAYDTSDLELRYVPLSPVRKGINAAAQSGPGTALINVADALSMGTLDNMTSNPAMTRAGMEGLRQKRPGWALGGQVAGGVAGALGAEVGLGMAGARMAPGLLANLLKSKRTGDMAFGAATGAGNADEGSRLGGAAFGGTAGLLGGMAGRGTARGVGNVIRGVRNPDVQALRAAGVPLTGGQALGGTAKRIEDKMMSAPLIGDIISNRRKEGLEAFNSAVFDQAVQPLGMRFSGPIAEEGVDALRGVRKQAYRDALDPVSLGMTPSVARMINQARGDAAKLPADMAEQGRYTLDRVRENVDPNGIVTGKAFQNMIRRLRSSASKNRSNPNGDDLAQALGGAEQGLGALLRRQNPGAAAKFAKANQVNRNAEVVRGAVNRARNGSRSGEVGVFTPSQLVDEAAANAKKFGGGQGTTNQPFFQLGKAGQRVLPSQYPDSGTAGRLATMALPAALGGSGGSVGFAMGDAQTGAATGLGAGLGIAGLLAAGGSKGGQKALVAALASRPDRLIRIGDKVYDLSNLLGPVGVPLGLMAGQSFTGQ